MVNSGNILQFVGFNHFGSTDHLPSLVTCVTYPFAVACCETCVTSTPEFTQNRPGQERWISPSPCRGQISPSHAPTMRGLWQDFPTTRTRRRRNRENYGQEGQCTVYRRCLIHRLLLTPHFGHGSHGFRCSSGQCESQTKEFNH